MKSTVQKVTLGSMSAVACALALALPLSALGYAGQILKELPCPVREPTGMASDGQFLWVTDMATRTVVKVRPADGTVADKLESPGDLPTGVAFHEGLLFTADRSKGWIARRKLSGGPDLSHLPYYERWAGGLVHDGAHLWVVDQRAAKIHRLDPVDGTTIQSFDAPGKAPTDLAFDGRYLWIADHGTDELYMVDRRDGKVLLPVRAPGPYPSGLAVLEGALWVADYQTERLYQLSLPDGTPYVEDQERRVRVSYEVTYRAEGAGRIVDLVSHVALPRELPGQHILSPLQFEPQPQRVVADRWGQRVAVFELGPLAAGEVRRVTWSGDFAVYRTRFQLVPEMVGEPLPLDPSLAPYLADDRKYDLEDPALGELVARLTAGKLAPYDRARAIYEHLTRSIVYDRSGGWNNAAAVLERGTGSCSEYTFALVAMLRKAGIPARYVGALSERGDEASYDHVFHRWAEAFFPGFGWVPIDANAGYGTSPGERGHYFGGRSNRHVITTVAGGESELLDWGYNSHQTYGVEGAATLDVQSVARFRPLLQEGEIPPHQAPRVVAPLLTDGIHRATGLRGLWYAVGAVAVSLGLGLGVGMLLGKRRQ